MVPYLYTGLELQDLALFLQRVVMGVFFLSYRFRWFYDPSQPSPWFSEYRQHKFRVRLCTCGYPRDVWMQALVATVQCMGGMALIVGLLTIPAAAGILCVMIFANCCAPKEEIAAMNPVDKVDYISCYLRLVEPLYLVLSANVLFLGPGKWSLDYILVSYYG